MGYLLLVLLVIELFVFYKLNGRNVVCPSFIGGAMFVFSTVVYLLSSDYFGYEIHGITVAVIIGLLVCIFIGERFADKLKVMSKAGKTDKKVDNVALEIGVSHWICVVLTIVLIVVSIFHFKKAYEYSLTVGNITGDIFTMTKYIREAVSNGYDPMDLPIVINQGIVFSECIVWFCVYSLCNNKNCTNKFYFRYLWPIVAYLPNVFVTNNRTTLLRMVAICFVIVFVFTKERYGWSKKGNVKIIFVGVLAVGLYLVAFRFLGYRTETSLRNELWDNLSEYISASLVGLDKYLLNGEAPNTLFGEGTLKNIYNILKQWGVPIPEFEQFEPFYFYANGNSNAYTTLKAYIHDYTIVGAAVAMFLWGAVINYSMKYIRQNGVSFVRMCVTAMMFYPVVMLSIADSTAVFLSMGTIYTLVYLFVIDIVFIKNKIRTV